MLADDTCWLLAADFDEGDWRRDVSAFGETCRRHSISRCCRTVPVRKRRPRIDFFRGAATGGVGAPSWSLPDHRNDGTRPRHRVSILRSVFSEPGHDAGGRLRQFDRFATSGALTRLWEQRVHRRIMLAVSRSVGLPVRNRSDGACEGRSIDPGGERVGKNPCSTHSPYRRRRGTMARPAVAPEAAASDRRVTAK